MLSGYQVLIVCGFPVDYSRLRLVANDERLRFVDIVLFNSVNLNRGMIGGRTKQVSLVKIRGVNVRTGIDDESRLASGHFNAERIVMAVRTAAVDATVAGVEKQIEIVVPHNIYAGIRKRL